MSRVVEIRQEDQGSDWEPQIEEPSEELQQYREYQGYFRNLRERRLRNSLQVLEEESQEHIQYIQNNLEYTEVDDITQQDLVENVRIEPRDQVNEENHDRPSIRKGLAYFSEVIPDCWLEILDKDTPMMYSIMQSFGSLACLLYYRVYRLCKEHKDLQDLRLLRSITCVGLNEARRWEEGGKFYELKFLILILDFYNYHVSLAKRDYESKEKVKWLIKIFPSFREMRYSIDNFYVHEDVSFEITQTFLIFLFYRI